MASERSVVVRIRAEVAQFRADMRQAAQATSELGNVAGAAGTRTSTAMTQAQAAAAATRTALIATGRAAQETAQGMGMSYNATGQLVDEFGQLVTEARAAEAGLETASDATREFASEQQHAANAAAASAGSLTRLTNDARDNADAWDQVGNSMLAFGAAAIAVVGVSIAKYAAFDKAMSNVEAATHESAANMELLREAAIRAGADTAFSAEEAAQGIEELAKAGVSTSEILAGGLDGALSLAAAGALGVGEAAEIAASALTQFKLSGDQIPHLADLLAAGAGKAQGSVQDLGNALNQTGLVAASTGLSIEETTGGLTAFASAGLTGSDAGTSFKSMLQRLTPQSKEAEAKMKELGISAYDAQGNFKGLAEFSENLKTAFAGQSDEARNAAMGVIFGSDAVRAANVLYEQGGAGIADWTDKVNDAGYAATTAAIMQDNLAGDIEKLGGSFDTVFIKGGGSASEALRGLVQSAESVVDAVGKIPTPVLETGLALIGTVGATALAGGAFLKFTPKVLDSISAFRGLGAEGSRIPGVMGRVAKGLTIATVAVGALSAITKATSKDVAPGVEEMANSMHKLSKEGEGIDSLNGYFQNWDTFWGASTVNSIDSVQDAIARLADPNFQDKLDSSIGNPLKALGAPDGTILQVQEKFESMGEALGNLSSNGALDTAAASFKKLATEFENQGMSAQEALDVMPGYKDSLIDLGNSVGVVVEGQDLLDLAMGKVPASMEAAGFALSGTSTIIGSFTDATGRAVPITEEMGKQLEEMGISASGAVVELSKYVDLLVRAGLSSLSTRDAQRGAIEAQNAFTEALAANGATLDTNTKAGLDNEAALDAVAQSRISLLQAMASETDAYGNSIYTQQQLQDVMRQNYDQYYDNAFAMTGNAEAADDLARKANGIPDDVNIDTWMSDYAKKMAEQTTGAIADIPSYKRVDVDYVNTTTNIVRSVNDAGHIAEGPGGRGGMTKATGGAVFGPGTGTSDSIPAWLSNGEHVLTAKEVQQMGGQSAVYAFRAQLDAGVPASFGAERVGREFSAPATSVAAPGGGSGTTLTVPVTIYGATDVNAVRQAVVGDIKFLMQKNGVRIGD